MRVQQLAGACLLAFASLSLADSLPANNYLWGPDRMGKMVEKRATNTKTSTTSTKASSAATSTTVKASSASAASSSSSKAASSASSTSLVADAACTNGPFSRSCWSNGYSIATDFDLKHPTTGNTVKYNFEITNTTCNVDGTTTQQCLLVNGQYPGPVLRASWGDYIEVTVKNSMQYNGTSMHWHGVRQYLSNGADGVNGITECPLAPGMSTTYRFQATQFGTSWYHSHYSAQYGMGVVGPIIIDGPASSNYDIDLGTFPITDWFYQGAIAANQFTGANLQTGNPPPAGDTFLINGTNKNSAGAGNYAQVTVTAGKKHRLRLINTSSDNFLRVKLDNHPFTVMTADFIPVVPIPGQDWVLLGIGQRYDVVFTANQTAATYWFRVEVAGDCYSANNGKGRALFTYKGASTTPPTDANTAAPADGCTELTTVPYWKQAVDKTSFVTQYKALNLDLTTEQVTPNGQSMVYWALNSTAMRVNWDHPTLDYVKNGTTAPASYDIIEIPNEGVTTYWIIQALQTTQGPQAIAAPPPPHPIHLHGHDFFVLGRGSGQYDGTTNNLNFVNPPRRDTATLPSVGWLALAFVSNNPGAWLMHCHISSHISEGLGVQFLESKSQIISQIDTTQYDAQCAAWRAFSANQPYPQDDSGL